ncbi:MAG: metallophosphoesterase [Burkholderiales bacterium]
MRIFEAAIVIRRFSTGLFMLLAACSPNQSMPDSKPAAENTARKNALHTLFIAGDIADCQSKSAAQSAAEKTALLLTSLLRESAASSVISVGDHTYPNGTAQEFSDCYAPTWGRFKHLTFPSPGNHDYLTPLASGYYDYFAQRAGPARRGYYSFDVAGWHVVSLNSNIADDQGAEQIAWLREDLAANKLLCTIAYWHHPLFTSGLRGNNRQMKTAWQILYDAGADIVLSAHDHHYERFAAQDADGNADPTRGIRQFLVGTGGANLSSITDPARKNSEAQTVGHHGVLRLDLQQGKFSWEFIPVAPTEPRDSGVGSCH